MKQTNTSVIGGFVVGALALAITGILIFGSGNFFKKTDTYVLFFEDSVKGLTVGAPVFFRGVEIGMVKQITLQADSENISILIPVKIQTDPSRWKIIHGKKIKSSRGMELLIKKGIRASLELQSLVTGKYVVELEFHPDTPAVFRGKDTKFMEVPTIQTGFSKLSKTLENLPVKLLFEKLTSAASGVDNIVNSKDTQAIAPAIHKTLENVQTLVEHLDTRVDPLSSSYITLAKNADQTITTVGKDIDNTVKDYQKLALDLDKQIVPLVAQIRMTAESIREGVKTADSTLESVKAFISNDSPVVIDLEKTLKELSSAARSIRVWADYLERHPEALIRGKGSRR